MPKTPLADTFTVGELTVNIHYDDDPLNPREEYDNLCTIWYVSSRYYLGDEQVSPDQITERLNDPDYFCLKVYAYIHSGTTISLSSGGQYSDPWDGGCCGIIWVSKGVAKKEFGYKRWTKGLEQKVRNLMSDEISAFDSYLRGEVYGYTVEDADGEVLDSCWGFIGDDDYVKSEARSSAECHWSEILSLREEESIQLVGAQGAD